MSHLAYIILLAQLIDTLIHYLCTVALTGLADWSAFLELVLLTMWSHKWDDGAYGGHYMEGMGLIFTPVLVRCLLGPLGLLGLWLALLGLIKSPNSPIGRYNLPLVPYPPPPPTCLSMQFGVIITVVAKRITVWRKCLMVQNFNEWSSQGFWRVKFWRM